MSDDDPNVLGERPRPSLFKLVASCVMLAALAVATLIGGGAAAHAVWRLVWFGWGLTS